MMATCIFCGKRLASHHRLCKLNHGHTVSILGAAMTTMGPEAAGWPSRYLPFRGSNRLEQTLASARWPVGYAAGITAKLPTSEFLKYDLAGVEGQVVAGVLRELVMLCCDQW